MPKHGFALVYGRWKGSQVVHHQFSDVLTRMTQYAGNIR